MQKIFYSKKENKYTKLSNWLFLISCICMTVLFSTSGGDLYTIIATTISIALSFYLFIIKKIQNNLLCKLNVKYLIFSIVASIFAEVQFCRSFYGSYYSVICKLIDKFNLEQFFSYKITSVFITFFIAMFAFLIICCLFYLAYTKIAEVIDKLYKSFNKIEKISFLIISVIFIVFIVVSYCNTYVFWGTQNFDGISYDVIYTSDSGNLYLTNCWLTVGAPENDLRQPLFGVFAAPFTVIPYALSLLLFFVPNLFAYLVAIEQVLLLILSVFLVIKLLDLDNISQILVSCIFMVSFPSLLFSLNLEQYIFAVFWLILFIYSVKSGLVNNENLFIISTGSLLTSGVLYPLIYKKENKIKDNLLRLVKLIIAFVLLCFVFGRGACLVGIIAKIKQLLSWSGKGITIIERFKQYSVFLSSCFIYPDSVIVNKTIRLADASSFNIFGIVVMALAVFGFILNRKEYISKVSFYWVCFSFVMLGLIGWGAKENGMILYTLYFSWAFVILIIQLINKIPQKLKVIKYVIYFACIVALLYFNIPAINKIIKFGIEFYPMV